MTFARRLLNRLERLSKSYTSQVHSIMDRQAPFLGKLDRYGSVTVDLTLGTDAPGPNFALRLQESLKKWTEEKRTTVWFKVDLANAQCVPDLAKQGFVFHHAKESCVTMYRWLPTDIESNLPPYAHTNLGVGGFVLNRESGDVLVVKDKHRAHSMWKLPGGYVNPGESIPNAAMREVQEETGILTEFERIVGFRHTHGQLFGCSDIYVIAALKPLSREMKRCDREIEECTWMQLEDLVNDPNISANNRTIVRSLLRYTKNPTLGFEMTEGLSLNKQPAFNFLTSESSTTNPSQR